MSTRFSFRNRRSARQATAARNLQKSIDRIGAAINQANQSSSGLGEYNGIWLSKEALESKLSYAKVCANNLKKKEG